MSQIHKAKEEKNIGRDLNTLLLYPGVLGYFLVGTMLLVNDPGAVEHFYCSHGLLVTFCILTLFLLTLVFFCCDFLGSVYVEIYDGFNIAGDLAVMIVIILIFSSLGFKDKINFEFDIRIFCKGYMAFMIIYLVKYTLRLIFLKDFHKRDYARTYPWLAIVEIIALGAFWFLKNRGSQNEAFTIVGANIVLIFILISYIAEIRKIAGKTDCWVTFLNTHVEPKAGKIFDFFEKIIIRILTIRAKK